jgi:hypothetical protein
MDAEWLQNLEARLSEQAEATRATNELITQLFSMMKMRNVATPPSLATSTGRGVLHPSQLRSVSHSPQIKPASPDNFDGDRSKGCTFLTSCELYLSLTGLDYPDEQYWALSFFKSRHAATFAEHIVRQEMRTGVMAFTDWTDFTSEFKSTFCPENETTSALMHLESDHYFQGQQNVEAYIDKFRDLVDMASYTDPIAIVLKFRRGLNATMQDKIAESGTDRLRDNDHQGWYAATRQFDLNRLANEAFHYASCCPTAQSTMP